VVVLARQELDESHPHDSDEGRINHMNLLVLVGLSLGGVLAIWLTQSVALWSVGAPQAWPLRSTCEHSRVKWTRRATVQGVWAMLLLGLPLTRGSDPITSFATAFPAPDWIAIGTTFLTCIVLMNLAFVIEIAAGWVQWKPQFSPAVRRAKLLRRFVTPVPLAIVEEAVFRGTLLAQIAAALPASRASELVAITASSALFSALHFVRPDDQRPLWQPAAGLFLFGALCGTAYVSSGHTLWMPVTIHAAGIFVTETMRLYTVFQGPRCMIGFSCFPHCGLVGATTLIVLAIVLLHPL
jgi:hypothetical protein